MNLYVWTEVLCDYTCGMVVILAHDLDEAFTVARKELSYGMGDLSEREPEVVDLGRTRREPRMWRVYGGG